MSLINSIFGACQSAPSVSQSEEPSSREASSTWPPLPYLRRKPENYTIAPKGKHTHTVILLHGAKSGYVTDEDCEWMHGFGNKKTVPELVDAAAKAYCSNGHGIKYIFPCAPPAAEGQPKGTWWYLYDYDESSPRWPKTKLHNGYYDSDAYKWQCDNDIIAMDQWTETLGWIKDLVRQEVVELGDASKVIIGGNSQGGTVAIDVALNFPDTLGALLCLRTCPMRETLGPVPARPLEGVTDGTNLKGSNLDMPIFCYIDGRDDTYIPPLQHRNYCLIQDKGYTVTTRVNPTAFHEDDDPAENEWAAKWIAQVFFSTVPTTPTMPTTDATRAVKPVPRVGLGGWGKFYPCCSKGDVDVPKEMDKAAIQAIHAGA